MRVIRPVYPYPCALTGFQGARSLGGDAGPGLAGLLIALTFAAVPLAVALALSALVLLDHASDPTIVGKDSATSATLDRGCKYAPLPNAWLCLNPRCRAERDASAHGPAALQRRALAVNSDHAARCWGCSSVRSKADGKGPRLWLAVAHADFEAILPALRAPRRLLCIESHGDKTHAGVARLLDFLDARLGLGWLQGVRGEQRSAYLRCCASGERVAFLNELIPELRQCLAGFPGFLDLCAAKEPLYVLGSACTSCASDYLPVWADVYFEGVAAAEAPGEADPARGMILRNV